MLTVYLTHTTFGRVVLGRVTSIGYDEGGVVIKFNDNTFVKYADADVVCLDVRSDFHADRDADDELLQSRSSRP